MWFCAIGQGNKRFKNQKCWDIVKNCSRFTTRGSFSCVKKTITHGSSSEQCPQCVPMVRFGEEIMARLRPLRENNPPCGDPVEPPLPMIEPSLYSIVSDYEDRKVSKIMSRLCPPKENTSPRRDPVEPPSPMIEPSLYSIVSDYEDQ